MYATKIPKWAMYIVENSVPFITAISWKEVWYSNVNSWLITYNGAFRGNKKIYNVIVVHIAVILTDDTSIMKEISNFIQRK